MKVERWITGRFRRLLRRNEEYLMLGCLRICRLCALPIVDNEICQDNPDGGWHDEFQPAADPQGGVG